MCILPAVLFYWSAKRGSPWAQSAFEPLKQVLQVTLRFRAVLRDNKCAIWLVLSLCNVADHKRKLYTSGNYCKISRYLTKLPYWLTFIYFLLFLNFLYLFSVISKLPCVLGQLKGIAMNLVLHNDCWHGWDQCLPPLISHLYFPVRNPRMQFLHLWLPRLRGTASGSSTWGIHYWLITLWNSMIELTQ